MSTDSPVVEEEVLAKPVMEFDEAFIRIELPAHYYYPEWTDKLARSNTAYDYKNFLEQYKNIRGLDEFVPRLVIVEHKVCSACGEPWETMKFEATEDTQTYLGCANCGEVVE